MTLVSSSPAVTDDDSAFLAEIVAAQHVILTAEFSLDAVLARLVEQAQRMTGASGAAVEFADGDEMVYRAVSGAASPFVGLRLEIATSLSGRCVQSGELVMFEDSRHDPGADGEACRKLGARSMVIVPLMHDGRVAGILKVLSDRPHAFADRDVLALEALAGVIGAAIARADLLTRLEQVARTDELTGLANRRRWDEELDRELARAGRHGYPLCLAMLDLDRFKDFNDTRGHQGGDRLLSGAAAGWWAELRRSDLLARYGGDEFALLLANCEQEDALIVVDRLIRATPLGQTCSAGVACWEGSESADELVARADAALYRAKRAGRDRVILAAAA